MVCCPLPPVGTGCHEEGGGGGVEATKEQVEVTSGVISRASHPVEEGTQASLSQPMTILEICFFLEVSGLSWSSAYISGFTPI